MQREEEPGGRLGIAAYELEAGQKAAEAHRSEHRKDLCGSDNSASRLRRRAQQKDAAERSRKARSRQEIWHNSGHPEDFAARD